MYARHRRAAGITQEKAAELLGVSVRTVANWEAGIYVPPDDAVAMMCDVYPAPTLAVEHLRASTALAAGLIPEVTQLPLAQAVAQLLYRMREFELRHRADDLLWISSNGRVDEGEESVRWAAINEELQDIVRAAIQLKYAQGANFPAEKR
ncbi:MAG: helix-turn-helix transcriptional regulator [Oscillospiraceae bacterium]|nr:helix-turn-helix transcriptional regulator [Oscillospiraceae bacterium]